MLRFQYSASHTFKNKKQSEYPFSLLEVHITLEFKSEGFLIYFLCKRVVQPYKTAPKTLLVLFFSRRILLFKNHLS